MCLQLLKKSTRHSNQDVDCMEMFEGLYCRNVTFPALFYTQRLHGAQLVFLAEDHLQRAKDSDGYGKKSEMDNRGNWRLTMRSPRRVQSRDCISENE